MNRVIDDYGNMTPAFSDFMETLAPHMQAIVEATEAWLRAQDASGADWIVAAQWTGEIVECGVEDRRFAWATEKRRQVIKEAKS
jgi:hypothetical protein